MSGPIQGCTTPSAPTAATLIPIHADGTTGNLQVDIAAIIPGVGATNLGKAEDAAHASGDTGVAVLAVQKATPADLATEGDYAVLEVSAGRLWVSGIVTDIVPGVGATNLGKAQDAVPGATDTGVSVLAVQKSTPANVAGTDGDYERLQMSTGRLWTSTLVTDLVPGIGATNLGKREDDAHTSLDVGVMALGVQKATPADLAADGDYAPFQVSAGRLWTSGVITDLVPGFGATNLGKREDDAHTSLDVGVMALAVQKATPADLGADGDYGPLQVSAGRLWTSGVITDLVPGFGATNLGKREDDAHTSLDVGVMALAVQKATPADLGADGDYGPLQVSGGKLWVDTRNATTIVVSLTRTADTNAYAAGDTVGAATGSTAALTFAAIGPASGDIMITSVAFECYLAAVISGMTTWRLHLYNVTPPSAYGDNVAWDILTGDRASYLGFIELGTLVDLGGTLYVKTTQVNNHIKLAASGNLFAYLQTIGGYTPSSGDIFRITLGAVAL